MKIPSLWRPDNSLALLNLDQANLFATDFENKFTLHPNMINSDHYFYVEASLLNFLPMCLLTNHTSTSEVLNIIKNLKKNKYPSYDLITNKIIKKLPKKAINLLTFIYNNILQLSHIPPSWKHSVIILIHKPGKPLMPPLFTDL